MGVGVGGMAELLKVNNQPQLTRLQEGNAIIDDRRSPRGIVTAEVAATTPSQ
jgi:hypothetical protein